MTELAQIVFRTQAEVPTAVITGEIDLSNAPDVERALTSVAGNGLVVDLTGTQYIDSAALRCLLAVAGAVRGSGHRFSVMARPGTAVRRVIELSQVETHLGLISETGEMIPAGDGSDQT
jgi:anti-anti-sigma factor